MKAWKIALYSLCAPPLVFSIGLTVFYFHAWSILGHAPSYDQPDPKTMEMYFPYTHIVGVALITTFFSFFASMLALLLYFIFNRRQLYWPPAILCAGSYAIAFCVVNTPMFDWFLD